MFFYDIVETGNYLLRDWFFFVNNFLFTDFPFYFLFGKIAGMNDFTLRLCAFFIFMAGVGLLSFLVFRLFGPGTALLSAVSLVTAPVFASRIVLLPYLRISTMGFSILSLLFLIRMMRGASGEGGKKYLYAGLFFPLVVLNVFSDPYYIFEFILPAAAAYAILRIMKAEPIDAKAACFLALSTAAAVITAGVLYDAAGRVGLYLSKRGLASDYITSSVMLRDNILFYFRALAEVFDMNLVGGGTSAETFFRAVRFALFALATAGALLHIKREKDIPRRFVLLYFLMLVVIVSAATVVKSMPAARYLTPAAYAYSLFTALLIAGGHSGGRALRTAVFLLFMIAASHNIYKNLSYDGKQPFALGEGTSAHILKTDHAALAKFLEGEGLYYGYSHYWHSNITTFLSGGRVKIRGVIFDRFVLEPNYFVTKGAWYKPSYFDGPTFLLLSEGDYDMGLSYLTPGVISTLFGPPLKTLSFQEDVIYVWPYNIMKTQLPSVSVSESTPHAVGQIEQTDSGKVLHSVKGERGALLYGNNFPFNQGRYKARFLMKVKGDPEEDEDVANIEVILSDVSAKRYDPQSVKRAVVGGTGGGAWREYPLDFAVGHNEKGNLIYEFRVFSTGKGDVKVRGISIEPL